VRKQFRLLLVILLVAVLGALAWQGLRAREPLYRGKPLSHWLGGWGYRPPDVTLFDAAEALDQTGTNAIPTLLRLLRANDSALTRKVHEWVEKRGFVKTRYIFAWERNQQAAYAIGILGAKAKGAVPALIALHDQNISVNSRLATAQALGSIGPAARQAVPALIRGLNSKDVSSPLIYIEALGHIHAEPALSVPALGRFLQDGDPVLRRNAVWALGEFGTEAKSTVPAILPLVEDPDADTQREANNALRQIDPEAAAKAAVK
jgi:hypothetical protein